MQIGELVRLKPIYTFSSDLSLPNYLSIANYFAIKENNLHIEFVTIGEESCMISDSYRAKSSQFTFLDGEKSIKKFIEMDCLFFQLISPCGSIWIRESDLRENFELVEE